VPTSPPLDPQGDECAVPGEGDFVAAGAGHGWEAPDFESINDGVELVVARQCRRQVRRRKWCTPTSPAG